MLITATTKTVDSTSLLGYTTKIMRTIDILEEGQEADKDKLDNIDKAGEIIHLMINLTGRHIEIQAVKNQAKDVQTLAKIYARY